MYFHRLRKAGRPVILGCEFNDKLVEAIYPRRELVELEDGTKIPIVRKPAALAADAPPIPSEQEYAPEAGRISPKLKVSRAVEIPAGTQTWVYVTSGRKGPSVLEANPQLYAKHRISLSNRVVHIAPLQDFKFLVANVSSANKRLSRNQVVGFVTPHPRAMMRTAMPLDAVLAAEFSEGSPPLQGARPHNGATSQAEPSPPPDAVPLDHLPAHVGVQVRTMLAPYAGMWDGKLSEVRATEHRIELTSSAKPFRCQPYRAGSRASEAKQASMDEMLAGGVIPRSKSEWASPVVLIPKSDGSLRFCVDYRRLNALTVRDTYPIPQIYECLDTLGEAKVFSTLDCNSGYWQIPVAEEYRPKNKFTFHAGTYQFNRMPFGLMNAPATFQRMLDIFLSGYRWKSCLIYLDDFIIFSKNYEAHPQDVDVVLRALQQEGL